MCWREISLRSCCSHHVLPAKWTSKGFEGKGHPLHSEAPVAIRSTGSEPVAKTSGEGTLAGRGKEDCGSHLKMVQIRLSSMKWLSLTGSFAHVPPIFRNLKSTDHLWAQWFQQRPRVVSNSARLIQLPGAAHGNLVGHVPAAQLDSERGILVETGASGKCTIGKEYYGTETGR